MSFNTKLKKPEISIKTFGGEFTAWNLFYKLFDNLIFKNKTLSDIKKFIYFKSFLKGEPLDLISSL